MDTPPRNEPDSVQVVSEFADELDPPVSSEDAQRFSEAVLHSSDWTVETIVSQLVRQNIDISPRFQRRDAWDIGKKSRFIESVVLGLPIPQIVLAERRGQRGRYIVLDGKQRLLSLLQFTGNGEGTRNAFRLSGLDVRTDLTRKTFAQMTHDPSLAPDLNAFNNYTVRAVVIRNWPDTEFLHLVFVRLNTGTVKLSPQELRQALFPGPFSNFVDDWSVDSAQLQSLLGRATPDPRMRDVELLVRSLAFHYFVNEYRGRMREFLDFATETLNAEWEHREVDVRAALNSFSDACQTIVDVFGAASAARKLGSRSFNRAIFDALVFYAVDDRIRLAMAANAEAVNAAYQAVLEMPAFSNAVESDTAGIPNTLSRLEVWGQQLRDATDLDFAIPGVSDGRIRFDGFWH